MKYFIRWATLLVLSSGIFLLFRTVVPSKHIIVDLFCAPIWASWSLYIPKFRKWWTAPFRVKNGTIRDYVPLAQYLAGKYLMPIIGTVVTIGSFTILFYSNYYFFFENNSLYLLKKLRKEINKLEPEGDYYIKFKWFNDLYVCIWDSDYDISIHSERVGECIVSSFATNDRDRIRIQTLYLLLRIKREEYIATLKPNILERVN